MPAGAAGASGPVAAESIRRAGRYGRSRRRRPQDPAARRRRRSARYGARTAVSGWLRVAFGAGMHQVGQPGIYCQAARPQHVRHRGAAQRRQPKDLRAGQPGQLPQQGPPGITSGIPAGHQHQQPRSGQLGRHLPQQEQRGMIGPVHIVQHHQQVAGLRCGRQRIRRGRRRAEPGPRWVIKTGSAAAALAGRPGAVADTAYRAQDPPPGPQRRRALLLDGTSPQHPLPAPARRLGQFLRQPGLADPRRPGQHDQPPMARPRLRQPASQCRQLPVTPGEPFWAGRRISHTAILPRRVSTVQAAAA